MEPQVEAIVEPQVEAIAEPQVDLEADIPLTNETDHAYSTPPKKQKIVRSRRLEESIQISKEFVVEIYKKKYC